MISSLIQWLLGGRAHLDAPADFDALKADLQAMALPAVALTFDKDDAVGPAPHSSIGGAPSLPSPDDWPMAGDRPYLFLAQINYAEMPAIEGYPTSGLLSIFVLEDDLFGCDFPSRAQKNFVTRFIPDPSPLKRVPPPAETEYDMYGNGLRKNGARLTGRACDGLPGSVILAVETLLRDLTPADADTMYDWLADQRPASVYYGGHPDFVQYDIRAAGAPETRVLLQQGHHWRKDRDWEICWGDAGEATFLIAPEDLKAQAFEKSLFNWDCG